MEQSFTFILNSRRYSVVCSRGEDGRLADFALTAFDPRLDFKNIVSDVGALVNLCLRNGIARDAILAVLTSGPCRAALEALPEVIAYR